MKYAALVMLMFCGCIAAQDITIVPSPNRTSAAIGLEFTLSGVSKDESGRPIIIGTIENTGDKAYEQVMITVTVKDSDGAFISRFQKFSYPREIDPGESGSIIQWLLVDRDTPVVLEYSLTGRLRETAPIAEHRDESRVIGNTQTAISALKAYVNAQTGYKLVGNPEYVADYRKLSTDAMRDQRLMVLSRTFANARIGDGCVAFRGYLFLEDPAVTDWKQ